MATTAATTTPEIDGQLKSKRRRLERVICEESCSNMQKKNLVYICHERERAGGKVSSLRALVISRSRTRKLAERTRSLHRRSPQKQMPTPKKVLIFSCCSCSLKPEQRLLQMTTYSSETLTPTKCGAVCVWLVHSRGKRSDDLWLPPEKQQVRKHKRNKKYNCSLIIYHHINK